MNPVVVAICVAVVTLDMIDVTYFGCVTNVSVAVDVMCCLVLLCVTV